MTENKTINRIFFTRRGNIIAGGLPLLIYLISAAIFTGLRLKITGILPPCKFFAATGLYCPGCGGTRSLQCLLRFQYISAFRFNPTVVLIFAAVMAICLLLLINGLRKSYTPLRYSFRAWHIALFGSAYLFFAVIRNIVWFDMG